MSYSACSPSTQNSEVVSQKFCEVDFQYSPTIFEIKHSIPSDISFWRFNSSGKNMKNMREDSQPLICCICGFPDLLHKCTQIDCNGRFHLNCLYTYFPPSDQNLICPSHTYKNLKEITKLLHMTHHFNSDPSLPSLVKAKQKLKNQSDLGGEFFWYGISSQYFPYFTINSNTFAKQTNFCTIESTENSWLNTEIHKTLAELSAVTDSTNSLITSLSKKPTNCCKRPKPGENIFNSSYIPLDLKAKYIRNYEKIQQQAHKFEHKDYHNYTSEEKIFCAICDQGDSTEENLIIICSACQVPVHCICYGIKSVPDSEWLCDFCKISEDKRHEAITCELCPVKGGAVKLTKDRKWVHVTCGRYLQGLTKKDNELDTRVICKEKFKLKCFSCRKKIGACVQCEFGRCTTSFHVECRKDLIERTQESVEWLCTVHKANKLARILRSAENRARDFFIEIAEEVWEKKPGYREIKVKKKKECKKEDVAEEKKKVLLHLTENKVVVKVMVNGKVAKVLEYISQIAKKKKEKIENAKEKRKIVENIETKMKEPEEKVENLPFKIKRSKENPEISILKTSKGDLAIKLRVPENLLSNFSTTKRQKISDTA